VKLPAPKVNKHFKEAILQELKSKIEGICTKHGFIKNDSIEIVSIQSGTIEMAALNGNVNFDVKFYADVCNPAVGSVIKCRVSNINKFGILAEVKPILEIIIAKNSVNIKSDIDLNTVQIGQDIFVEVVGKKYELLDRRICIIGRIVTSPQTIKAKKSIKQAAEMAAASIEEAEEAEQYDDYDAEADAEDGDEDDGDEDEEEEVEAEPEDEIDGDVDDGEVDDIDDDDDDKGSAKIGGADFFDSDTGSVYNMFDGADSASGGGDGSDGDYLSDY